jgi:hypothetical protein
LQSGGVEEARVQGGVAPPGRGGGRGRISPRGTCRGSEKNEVTHSCRREEVEERSRATIEEVKAGSRLYRLS